MIKIKPNIISIGTKICIPESWINEISTQLSNKFHAIVGQGNYNTKYDIDNLSYGEQVVVALNSKIKNIKQGYLCRVPLFCVVRIKSLLLFG